MLLVWSPYIYNTFSILQDSSKRHCFWALWLTSVRHICVKHHNVLICDITTLWREDLFRRRCLVCDVKLRRQNGALEQRLRTIHASTVKKHFTNGEAMRHAINHFMTLHLKTLHLLSNIWLGCPHHNKNLAYTSYTNNITDSLEHASI